MRKGQKGQTRLWEQVCANPRYRGRHVIVVGDEVLATRSATEASRLFDRVTRAHPRSTPTLLYVPQADALILWRTA